MKAFNTILWSILICILPILVNSCSKEAKDGPSNSQKIVGKWNKDSTIIDGNNITKLCDKDDMVEFFKDSTGVHYKGELECIPGEEDVESKWCVINETTLKEIYLAPSTAPDTVYREIRTLNEKELITHLSSEITKREITIYYSR